MSSTLEYRGSTTLEPAGSPTGTAPGTTTAPRFRWRSRWHRLAGLQWTSVVLVAAVALTARLTAVPTAYDIFIDEISYTTIARSVAVGHGAKLYGFPFLLHPPAAFGLWAAVLLATGQHDPGRIQKRRPRSDRYQGVHVSRAVACGAEGIAEKRPARVAQYRKRERELNPRSVLAHAEREDRRCENQPDDKAPPKIARFGRFHQFPRLDGHFIADIFNRRDQLLDFCF